MSSSANRESVRLVTPGEEEEGVGDEGGFVVQAQGGRTLLFARVPTWARNKSTALSILAASCCVEAFGTAPCLPSACFPL